MTTWTYDGTDLSTFGVITELDDYLDIAPRRGGDITIPNRHGELYVEKVYDSRSISFGMAIKASNAEALEQVFDDLKTLFYSETQKVLANTRADTTVRTVLATVEDTLQVRRESYNFARCVVNFKLANPFFRGEVATDDNTTVIDSDPTVYVVENIGNTKETDPVIILTGPLENTVITNSTTGAVLVYNGVIPSPRIVTIQTVNMEYVAVDDLGANMIDNIEHVGSDFLMTFAPGDNNLSVADDEATTGTVQFVFYPPYL